MCWIYKPKHGRLSYNLFLNQALTFTIFSVIVINRFYRRWKSLGKFSKFFIFSSRYNKSYLNIHSFISSFISSKVMRSTIELMSSYFLFVMGLATGILEIYISKILCIIWVVHQYIHMIKLAFVKKQVRMLQPTGGCHCPQVHPFLSTGDK